jgi:hypothetical protein
MAISLIPTAKRWCHAQGSAFQQSGQSIRRLAGRFHVLTDIRSMFEMLVAP